MTRITFPRSVLIGPGMLEKLSEVVKESTLEKNVLIVTDTFLKDKLGKQVEDQLRDANFEPMFYVTEKANETVVREAEQEISKNKTHIVLGMGGGTCVDVAKLAAANQELPFISVPTAATTDAICSATASMKEKGKLVSHPARAPAAIVADTTIIGEAPARFLAAGCGDLVSNYTAVEDWRLAMKENQEKMNEYASGLSLVSAQQVLDNPERFTAKSEEVVKTIVTGLVVSGFAMIVAGSSRPCSGSEHLFSHALDQIAEKPAMHGEQVGVGTIIAAKLHGLDWERVRDVLKKVGAPTNAKELNIQDDLVIEALTMAHTVRDRYTIFRNGLSEKDARAIVEETNII